MSAFGCYDVSQCLVFILSQSCM